MLERSGSAHTGAVPLMTEARRQAMSRTMEAAVLVTKPAKAEEAPVSFVQYSPYLEELDSRISAARRRMSRLCVEDERRQELKAAAEEETAVKASLTEAVELVYILPFDCGFATSNVSAVV